MNNDDEGNKPQGRRRILHEIRVDKIAAVDAPCVEHALATILKRADPAADLHELPGEVLSKLSPEQREQASAALARGAHLEIQDSDGTVLATAKRATPPATSDGQKRSARARTTDATVVKITSYHQELRGTADDEEEEGRSSPKTFMDAVAHCARRDRSKRSVAMGTAAREFPKLYSEFQNPAAATAKAQPATPKAVRTQHQTETVGDARAKWDDLVASIATERKIPKWRAMSAAKVEQPAIWSACEEEANRTAKSAQEAASRPIEKSSAIVDFEKMASAIQQRDGISRTAAWHRVAVENPRLLEKYQAALS